MHLIDSHCHINFPDFADHIPELLANMAQNQVAQALAISVSRETFAEVLSADAYAAFEESGDVAECGRRFWQEILAVGGSRSAAESFQAFRGRAPSIDALLRHSGFDLNAA